MTEVAAPGGQTSAMPTTADGSQQQNQLHTSNSGYDEYKNKRFKHQEETEDFE